MSKRIYIRPKTTHTVHSLLPPKSGLALSTAYTPTALHRHTQKATTSPKTKAFILLLLQTAKEEGYETATFVFHDKTEFERIQPDAPRLQTACVYQGTELPFTLAVEKNGDGERSGIYENPLYNEVVIDVHEKAKKGKKGKLLANVFIGGNPEGEPRVLITTGNDGNGDHSVAVYPGRPEHLAVTGFDGSQTPPKSLPDKTTITQMMRIISHLPQKDFKRICKSLGISLLAQQFLKRDCKNQLS